MFHVTLVLWASPLVPSFTHPPPEEDQLKKLGASHHKMKLALHRWEKNAFQIHHGDTGLITSMKPLGTQAYV
jgi:hypothetical protein